MNERFLKQAIELAKANVEQGKGGPFGAVIRRSGYSRRHQHCDFVQRPYRTCRSQCRKKRLQSVGQFQPFGLRNLFIVRTVSYVLKCFVLGKN